MKKISEIFKNKRPVFSIELFPPKTDKGYDNLKATISEMAALAPDFFSCTYGAGGGSRDKTLDIVEFIQNTHGIPAMAHLTCVLHTKEEIRAIVSGMKSRGVANILALRGDPPQDNPGWTPGPGNFRYSSELAADIRRQFSPLAMYCWRCWFRSRSDTHDIHLRAFHIYEQRIPCHQLNPLPGLDLARNFE